eukprot:2895862-Alexandrium_andersonii.AAC.1
MARHPLGGGYEGGQNEPPLKGPTLAQGGQSPILRATGRRPPTRLLSQSCSNQHARHAHRPAS